MINFTLKSELPVQDITLDELMMIGRINMKSVLKQEPVLKQETVTHEELELVKKLETQHKIFDEYVYQNFDFQIFYEEYYPKSTGFGLKKQFTVYVKIPIGGVTRDVYYYYQRKTWYDKKAFKSFHWAMEPILRLTWSHLKIEDVCIYDPMRDNIKARNEDWTKNLSLLPTLNSKFDEI